MKQKDVAIRAEHVSKMFKIPHEQRNTLRERVTGFRKKNTYESFKALQDVTFEIKKGEFFGIIGRNGSGKSTLLKILAGIYTPDSGSVRVNGEISPFLELGVGFNTELSGKDNIYLNGTILGLTKKEIDKKYQQIVEFSELERFIHTKLKNYSSGMQVRLAFSVSVHANKDILLMDEVLAVGDTNFQAKCLSEFVKYKEAGKTVVLVTHDTGTVQRYCDRVMLLRNGAVSNIGPSDAMVAEYHYQNMSDEERRIKTEEKAKAEDQIIIVSDKTKQREERKNKTAEISGVKILDKDGNEKNVFETGEDMTIRVHFIMHKKVKAINFGIGIFNQENQYFFGVNTFMNKIDTRHAMKNGYCQIEYKNIPLLTNSYFINFAIYGENDGVAYDYSPKLKTFKVSSKDFYHGTVVLDHSWK